MQMSDKAGDDFHIDLEPCAEHPAWVLHAVLPVKDKIAYYRMDYLPVEGKRYRLGRFGHTFDIAAAYLVLLLRDRYIPLRIITAYIAPVAARDQGKGLCARHRFGLLDCA